MPPSRLARWRAAIRDTPFGPKLAVALWAVFAFCVWNVVFDRVLVLAGRRYVYAALLASQQSKPFLRIDEWMRPAVTRGFWAATAAGTGLLAVGLAGVLIAARRRTTTSSGRPRRR